MNVITQGDIYSNASGKKKWWKSLLFASPIGAAGYGVYKLGERKGKKSGSDVGFSKQEETTGGKSPDTKAPIKGAEVTGADTQQTQQTQQGMSKNAKIGLAVGGLVVVGLVIFLATRKK
jgi:hypothetical protein